MTNYLVIYYDGSGNILAHGYSQVSNGDPCGRRGQPGVSVDVVPDGSPPDNLYVNDLGILIPTHTYQSGGRWSPRGAAAIQADRVAQAKVRIRDHVVTAQSRVQAARALATAFPSDQGLQTAKSDAEAALQAIITDYQS